ncbi:hypothetical protein M0R45_034334 [Rubus argutus]|uniref:RING-type E3 ubiquitin transferase n=1 Tax=Rubus argutus TaxID=59490 RepID=A0AAW1VU64_RUBAR
MGGCCCSSRKAHLHGAPVYFYCSPALEEEESLTSHDVAAASAITAGLLVELDLESSIPDTYRSPPTPLPYDIVFGYCKVKENSLPSSPKKLKISKSNEAPVLAQEDEDVCPICLEDYETENPDFTTKCEHHYHLSCILEWMERSDTCPICDQELVLDDTYSL